jgi:hypothetical protein
MSDIAQSLPAVWAKLLSAGVIFVAVFAVFVV